MPQRVSSPTFVGRAPELETLDAALRRARDGTPAFAFVAGESGVGKSRLVAELETRAGAAGVRVLVGHCLELGGTEVPYAALVSALRPIARELAECGSDLGELLSPGTRAALSELLPELGEAQRSAAAEPEDRGGRQARLFEALLALLERLGQREPVLLALEDIHWADASTRDFLVFLVRTARAERLCLVVTYRSDELHRRHPLRPLLAELERSAGVERLRIERFTRAEVVEQLAGIRGEAPDPDLVDRLFDRSQGNPLYTEELLAVTAEGVCELPETLRDALLTRVERLPAAAQEVARIAAISLRPTRHQLLQAVSTLPPDELLQGIREAVAQQVLVPAEGDAYAFRHALVGEAVDEDLLPGERSALHAAMATAIEARPELVGDLPAATVAAKLAGHWYHAHDLPHALAASVRAGMAAQRVYACSEAKRQLERALELWDRVPDAEQLAGMDRAELLHEAADAANTIGEVTRAVALMRQAIALVDEAAEPRRAALLYVALGRYRRSGDDSLAAFQRALDLLPDDAPAIDRARVHEAYAKVLMLTSRNDEAIRMAQEAMEAACAADKPGLEGRALVTLGLVHAARGDVDGAARLLRRSADLALQLDWHSDYVRAIIHLTEALDGNGRTPEALEIARDALEKMVRPRPERTSYDIFLELQAANHLVRLGRLTEAWDGLPEHVPGDPADSASRYAHELRAHIAILRGDLPTAHEHVDGLRRAGASILEPHWIEPAYRLPAELALLEGRHDDARAAIAEGLPLVEQSEDMLLILRLCWAGLRIEADIAARARALGEPVDTGRARRLEAAVARVADRPQWREGPAYAALARAELARLRHEAGDAPPDAPAWAAAAAAFDELQHPWPAAYARFRHAEALVAGGAFSDAAEPLRAACAAAATMGAAPLHGEIAALARRARIVLDGPAPAASEASAADRLGLTPREREVLLLVADGCTNREIGASLYMSEKTASVHVSRILAKLGVSRRVEAAAVAHRTGLTAEAEAAGAYAGRGRKSSEG